jgi:hypothetical protein
MEQNNIGQLLEFKPPLAGVVQFLQDKPRMYKTFGVYWWQIKAWLKVQFDTDTLYFLDGATDDVPTRVQVAAYWKHDPKKIWKAAINHMQTQVATGQLEGVSSIPERVKGREAEERPYLLYDADMGMANL